MKETILRVKLQGYDSLQNFIEYYSESIISQYIQSKLEVLFTDFNKDDNGCPHHLDKLLLILLVV